MVKLQLAVPKIAWCPLKNVMIARFGVHGLKNSTAGGRRIGASGYQAPATGEAAETAHGTA